MNDWGRRASYLPERMVRSIHLRGLSGTMVLCRQRLSIHLKRLSPTNIRIANSEARFDEVFGVRTGGIKHVEQRDIPYATWTDATHYQASNPFVFNAMMSALAIDYRQFAFVDVGSGKGRTLLLASRYGFKEVLGIEFDAELHATAVENLRSYASAENESARVRCLHADATQWRPSADKIVLYLFNPFGARSLRAVLERVSEGLRARSITEVYVLYLNPVHEEVLRQNTLFHRVRRCDKFSFVIYLGSLAEGFANAARRLPNASCVS